MLRPALATPATVVSPASVVLGAIFANIGLPTSRSTGSRLRLAEREIE
jgi:hypothetical protein